MSLPPKVSEPASKPGEGMAKADAVLEESKMQEDQESNSVERDDIIFTAAKRFTGAYLFLIFIATAVNFTGYERWLFGLDPELAANGVGDTLAGIFAPLAFLWFFVSTWLQRKELKETRAELAKQATEMKKAAEESANQTKIMQSREVYEEHRQRLYYLAAYIWRTVPDIELFVDIDRKAVGISFITFPYPDFKFTEDNMSIDGLLRSLGESMNKAIDVISSPDLLSLHRPTDISPETMKFYGITPGVTRYNDVVLISATVNYLATELIKLTRNEQYRDNPLIAARITGTDLDGTTDAAKALADKLVGYVAGTYPSAT